MAIRVADWPESTVTGETETDRAVLTVTVSLAHALAAGVPELLSVTLTE
jgi:hypothetical protein